MERIDHTVDPHGDTILILRNPDAPFAVWNDHENETWSGSTSCADDEVFSTFSETRDQLTAPDGRDTGGLFTIPPLDPSTDSSTISCLTPNTASKSLVASDANTSSSKDVKEIRMRVSSRHLILASRFFEKMLGGAWKESQPDANSPFIVYAQDWDTDALLLLMNIIHGRNRLVPELMNVEFLARVGVLVEYYQCHEAVQFISQVWLVHFKDPIPREYGRDSVLLLFVCWIFRYGKRFEDVASHVILGSDGPIDTLDLPIPTNLIDTLSQYREVYVGSFIFDLHHAIDVLRSDHWSCISKGHTHYYCTCILLGVLTRFLLRLQWQFGYGPPLPPYDGLSWSGLAKEVRTIEIPGPHESSCTLEAVLASTLRSLDNMPALVKLEDYKVQSD